MTKYTREDDYYRLAKGFRASNYEDKQILEGLFDWKDDLENRTRNAVENTMLVSLYSLLDFHAKAYALFAEIADVSNRKEAAKSAVLKEKAATHQDVFARKDPRKSTVFLACVLVEQIDFLPSETDATYLLWDKELVIFQQRVASKRVRLRKDEKSDLTSQDMARLNSFLMQLVDYKKELIHFYHTAFSEVRDLNASKSWYRSLEVYGVDLTIGVHGICYAEITVGDSNFEDHLLDITCGEQGIESMYYDG